MPVPAHRSRVRPRSPGWSAGRSPGPELGRLGLPVRLGLPGLLGLFAAAALVLAGCGSSGTSKSSTTSATTAPGSDGSATTSVGGASAVTTVHLVDFDVSPREVTIARGGTVTWVNDDPVEHWVVSAEPDVLDSGRLGNAQSWSHTFAAPGEYHFYCSIHNFMKGTIVVQ